MSWALLIQLALQALALLFKRKTDPPVVGAAAGPDELDAIADQLAAAMPKTNAGVVGADDGIIAHAQRLWDAIKAKDVKAVMAVLIDIYGHL